MSTIKLGKISLNLRTGRVNFDRRTIKKGSPYWLHTAYFVGGLVATAAVVALTRK